MKRNSAFSVVIGTTVAAVLWLTLTASDEIFQSRLLPWVVPLIYLQEPGIRVESRLFHCQKEGFDTGCEAYKVIPTLIGTNAILYSILAFPLVRLRRLNGRGKRKGSAPLA